MINKYLAKIVGIFGFKLVEKNLIKNKRLLINNYYSLDLILNHLFLNNNIKDVIQIGSNDGDRFDPLNKYLNKYQTNTIFVEPIKKYFEKLKKNYSNKKNYIFENSAISNKNGIYEMYKVNEKNLNLYDDHVAGISSFNKSHLLKHSVKKKHIISEKVNSLTVSSLMKKYDIKNLDLLFMDVEGHEGVILNNFFENIELRPIIVFEFIHIKNDIFEKIVENLKSKKFLYSEFNENLICFPEEKKHMFELN